MAYTVKTDSTHSKWWFTGTGSTVNRLSELMDDQADGPYYDVGDSWTQSAGDAAEYYHAPTKQPDNVYVSGVKLTEQADDTCIDGGGGGLADGEWCWETGNSRVYVQVAAGDPAGNADFYYDWNGGNSGTDFMTEVVEDRIYLIHLYLEIGDGSTSTTLVSESEHVYFEDNIYFLRKAEATLTIGSQDGTTGDDVWGKTPSYWSFDLPDDAAAKYISNGSTGKFQLLGSILNYRANNNERVYCGRGTCEFRNCILSCDDGTQLQQYMHFMDYGQDLYFSNVYISGFRNGFVTSLSPQLCENVWSHDANRIAFYSYSNVTFIEPKWTKAGLSDVGNGNANTRTDVVLNPKSTINTVQINNANTVIYEKFTFDILIVDKAGSALQDAYVNLYGSIAADYDTAMWTEDSVQTAADGKITQQQVTTRTWTGTSETLADYNVFKLVVRLAGYEDLTIENITISEAIDWSFELQSIDHPPDAWRFD